MGGGKEKEVRELFHVGLVLSRDYDTNRGLCGPGGRCSGEARELITMINTKMPRDEKNRAFSVILLRYATKMEGAMR